MCWQTLPADIVANSDATLEERFDVASFFFILLGLVLASETAGIQSK